MDTCFFCDSPVGYKSLNASDVFGVRCDTCGYYKVTLEASMVLVNLNKDQKRMLAGLSREAYVRTRQKSSRSEASGYIELTTLNIDALLRSAPTSVPEILERLLVNIAANCRGPSDAQELRYETDLPLAFCDSPEEFHYFVNHLIASGYLQLVGGFHAEGCKVVVSVGGWSRIEELKRKPRHSDRGFIAMWFGKEMDAARDRGLIPGIIAAGYKHAIVSQEEFTGGFFDKIISLIRESRFVVGDLSGARPNAYLEIGYAMGMGIQTILTCREPDLKSVNSDLIHMNLIVWSTPEELAARLEQRIRAVIGRGPHVKE